MYSERGATTLTVDQTSRRAVVDRRLRWKGRVDAAGNRPAGWLISLETPVRRPVTGAGPVRAGRVELDCVATSPYILYTERGGGVRYAVAAAAGESYYWNVIALNSPNHHHHKQQQHRCLQF